MWHSFQEIEEIEEQWETKRQFMFNFAANASIVASILPSTLKTSSVTILQPFIAPSVDNMEEIFRCGEAKATCLYSNVCQGMLNGTNFEENNLNDYY